MIYHYGITQQGHYHIRKALVCQDAHFFTRLDDSFAIGAVADGLGSQKFTDVASKIAAEESVNFCAKRIQRGQKQEDILSTLCEAFAHALKEINHRAELDGNPTDQYDTTLAVAVFLDGDVYYGNAGDSGMIVETLDGRFEPLTQQQRDENGCVYPLCFGKEFWAFGKKENVASVLLATDGMYEIFFPYLLKNEPVNLYVALAHYMMSEESLDFSNTEESQIQQYMEGFVTGIDEKQVDDDKTVLVMVDSSAVVSKQSEEYYRAPDWTALKEKFDEAYRREAYPHLYADKD